METEGHKKMARDDVTLKIKKSYSACNGKRGFSVTYFSFCDAPIMFPGILILGG